MEIAPKVSVQRADAAPNSTICVFNYRGAARYGMKVWMRTSGGGNPENRWIILSDPQRHPYAADDNDMLNAKCLVLEEAVIELSPDRFSSDSTVQPGAIIISSEAQTLIAFDNGKDELRFAELKTGEVEPKDRVSVEAQIKGWSITIRIGKKTKELFSFSA